MSANQGRFRVTTMARVLGVSPSGYYASVASSAPGIFKSASIARSLSRRSIAVAFIPPPPHRPATSCAPP